MTTRGALAGTICAMAQTADRRESGFTMGRAIGWVILAGMMFWPRLFILGFAIFSDQIGHAFSGWVVPFLGFFVLPWTTVTYAIMWGVSSDRVAGIEWVVVGVAFVADLLTWALARRLWRG